MNRQVLLAALAVALAALMALGAQVSVPMVPVPMTLQTFAVLLAGAMLGPRWGVASVLLYLGLAALGLPILSDGASGIAPFSGPTAGYLVGFVIAAGLAGMAARRDRLNQIAQGVSLLFALHLLVLSLGTAWLARAIGLQAALAAGFVPFLAGALVKSLLVFLVQRFLRKRLPGAEATKVA